MINKNLFDQFKKWSTTQDIYVFSGCVEEKYPAIKKGLLYIGEILGHKMHTYDEQSCCSGPLTKMGLGNQCTLGEFTIGNLDLRKFNEKIMLTSCNGCYSYMIKSKKLITDLSTIQSDTIDLYEKPILIHAIEYLSTWNRELEPLVKYNLNGINFVTQYGCHYLNQYHLSKEKSFRNEYAKFKNQESWGYNSIPTYLNDIVEPLGANIIDYTESLLCCGGSTPQRQINIDNSINIAKKKFESINTAKPDAILTICPLCMYFMEDSQNTEELESEFEEKIPIIHIGELLGLITGNDELIELMKKSHQINIEPLIEKIIG